MPALVVAPTVRGSGHGLVEMLEGGLPAPQQHIDRIPAEAVDQVQSGQGWSGAPQAVALHHEVSRHRSSEDNVAGSSSPPMGSGEVDLGEAKSWPKGEPGRRLVGQHSIGLPQLRGAEPNEGKVSRLGHRVDPREQPHQAAPTQVGVDGADQVRMAAAANQATLLLHNAIDLGLCGGHAVRMRIRTGCRPGSARSVEGAWTGSVAVENGNHALDPAEGATRREFALSS